LIDFLHAYLNVRPLTIGELWALPLMLRIALIEDLSQLAIAVARRQRAHERADFWANRLLNAVRLDPDQVLELQAELAREQTDLPAYFVDRLLSQLHGEPIALDPLRAWLERRLGAPVLEVIQQEQHQHAADQVTIANVIGSLRRLSQLDWRNVFERVDPVDPVLETAPGGFYPHLDFAPRDGYRGAGEEIARGSGAAELEVARAAVEAARESGGTARERHVGYSLVGAGRLDLESRFGYRPPLGQRLRRFAFAHPAL